MPELADKGGVGLALRCCGAPARWAGQDDLFEQSKADFLKEYAKLGKPEIIVACSSCFQVFKETYPEIPIRSLWTILDNSSMVSKVEGNPIGTTISIHDPCTTRYETAIHENVRHMISEMGYTIEELPLNREKTECCSYGGLMWLANPPLAKKVIERRITESQNAFVTYCVMCRDFFIRQGKTTYHILDLLFNPSLETCSNSPRPIILNAIAIGKI